jgi:tetratricopeptide (TPR) repeat protein
MDVMTSLVDKSLIMVERHAGHTRYRFLEPIRQYAHERLDARGDLQAVRRSHALHYLQVAEDAALEVVKHHLTARLDRLEREHDNFRAALEWSTQHGDGETGLRLAAALRWFWLVRGYASEGRAWLRRAFAAQDTATPIARARALVAAGSLAMFQHDHAAATASLEAALDAWREIGDARGIAAALLNLGHSELNIGNTARAEALLRESLELVRALRDDSGTASCLYRLGDLAATVGDVNQAQALTEESLDLGRRMGDEYRIASALHVLGHFAYMRGDLDTATAQLRESLVLSMEVGDRRGIAVCMESAAMLAGVRGHPERAARLFGAAARLRAATLAGRRIWIEAEYVRGVAATRTAVGESAYAAAAAAGGALSLSAAVAEAVATLGDCTSSGEVRRKQPS